MDSPREVMSNQAGNLLKQNYQPDGWESITGYYVDNQCISQDMYALFIVFCSTIGIVSYTDIANLLYEYKFVGFLRTYEQKIAKIENPAWSTAAIAEGYRYPVSGKCHASVLDTQMSLYLRLLWLALGS